MAENSNTVNSPNGSEVEPISTNSEGKQSEKEEGNDNNDKEDVDEGNVLDELPGFTIQNNDGANSNTKLNE